MITLKDLNALVKHLHHANEIFDTEAILEEKKHKDHPVPQEKEHRKGYAPRSTLLHSKARLAETIEKRLLCEYDRAVVSIEEDTIYQARELITESMYPWIHRKEPPVKGMDELLDDPTFIPFSSGLVIKKGRLLTSGIHTLNLPYILECAINDSLLRSKNAKGNEVIVTVGDILDRGLNGLVGTISPDKEIVTQTKKLLFFKLYILGLIDRKEYKETI